MGQLSGPKHQVHHLSARSGEAFFGGFGPLSVTVMVRTDLFPYCRSRLLSTTPAPHGFFLMLAEAFRQATMQGCWELPSLAEVQVFTA